MVKRIKLSDTDAEEVNGNSSVDADAIVHALTALGQTLEKMDWKLWELYKTGKRVEKYLEIEDLDVTKKS